MFGLAGMPLTSGFVSKFILITNLWSYEKYLLVVVLMLSTVVGFYFYLRPIWIASIEKNENPLSKIDISTSDKVSVGLLAVVTLLLGILPNVVINLTRWVVENYI